MDLKWLEDMLLLIEEGSFSRAAQRRHLSQPAFSRRIRALEQWYGVSLVDRSRNPIVIADAARACEAEVRALVSRVHELRSRMRAEASARHRISFGAQHTLAVSVFPALIRMIHTDIEKVSYRLRTANKAECLSTFLRGETDFLLCYETDSQPTELPFAAARGPLKLGREVLIPVVGGNLIDQLDASGRPSDPVPLLAYPETSFLGQALASGCLESLSRQHEVDRVCESAFSAGVKEMVLGGMGLAWLPSGLALRDIEAGEMVNLASHYGRVELDVMLYCSSTNQSELADRIFDGLHESVTQIGPGPERLWSRADVQNCESQG